MPGFRKRVYQPVPSIRPPGLYDAIRSCTACPLHQKCAGPAPGVGALPARIMLVGEAPGENEDVHGIPFTGASWEEMERFLQPLGLRRDAVYITNTVKCRPAGDPSAADAALCAPVWLDVELRAVRPQIVVALGQLAARTLLGRPDLTLEGSHGIPERLSSGVWVLPVYHPAAGFYNPLVYSYLQDDMESLRELMAGRPREKPVDRFWGRERYEDWRDGGRDWSALWRRFWEGGTWALDTETSPDGALWCLSVSDAAGTGLVFSAQQAADGALDLLLQNPQVDLVMHNAVYDLKALAMAGVSVRVRRVWDTLTAARLLQLESGALKDLARRRLGMAMETYTETLGDAQQRLALDYLRDAIAIASREGFPAPPEIREDFWDAKAERLSSRMKRPRPLAKKLTQLVAQIEAGAGVDSLDRWRQYSPEERRPVEDGLGQMPVAFLAHVDPARAAHYSARDADATVRLWPVLAALLERAGMWDLFERIETGSLPMIAAMAENGLPVNRERFAAMKAQFEGAKAAAEMDCWVRAGRPFNPASPVQVPVILEGAGIRLSKRTAGGGMFSTDDAVLAPLAAESPLISSILEWRKYAKLLDAYAGPILDLTDAGGRLRADLSGATVTGRIAARNPNVLALPKRSVEGKQVRNGFEAGPGRVFLAADYSQIEVRVFAHEAQDAVFIRAFWAGEDIHAANAAAIYRVALDAVTGDQRAAAKNVTFGVLYGIEAEGLLTQMRQRDASWTRDGCQKLLLAFRAAHPQGTLWQEKQRAFCRRTGYVTDMFGRRRLLPAIRSSRPHVRAEAERHAVNTTIQSGAQGIIRLAMAEIWRRIEGGEGVFRRLLPVLQIHDELLFEVEEEAVLEAAAAVREIMETRVDLLVPTPVEWKSGKFLGNLE